MTVERDTGVLLHRRIHQRVEPPPVHAVLVAVGEKHAHAAELDHGRIRRGRHDIAVAAHDMERQLREGLAQRVGVAGIVAQVDKDVRLQRAHRLQHAGGVPVRIGKNGSNHDLFSFFCQDYPRRSIE